MSNNWEKDKEILEGNIRFLQERNQILMEALKTGKQPQICIICENYYIPVSFSKVCSSKDCIAKFEGTSSPFLECKNPVCKNTDLTFKTGEFCSTLCRIVWEIDSKAKLDKNLKRRLAKEREEV